MSIRTTIPLLRRFRLHPPARSIWVGMMVIVLLIGACQGDDQPTSSEEGAVVESPTSEPAVDTSREPRPDAPAYALRGQFAVGHRALTAEGEEGVSLDISSWYPAAPGATGDDTAAYPVAFKDATWQPTVDPVVNGTAFPDAAPNSEAGPYPLIVLSHSFTGSTAGYSSLAEHYASYGFVVLAPEHAEEFDETFSALWTALVDRPADIVLTLDYAEAQAAPDGEFEGLIDMDRVAVVGHSYGGYTALAMAGARVDLQAFNERCDQLPEDHPSAFICMALVPNEAAMAERAGVDTVAGALWPSMGDPRVKAIVPMAGDAYIFDTEGLSEITIPMMAMGGTADYGTPYDWGAQLAYDHASSDRKHLVGLHGAEHMIFATPCDQQPWMAEHPSYGYICFDPVWDVHRAQDLIHHLSTAFLLDVLQEDQDARDALAPEAVYFPGIEYSTSME